MTLIEPADVAGLTFGHFSERDRRAARRHIPRCRETPLACDKSLRSYSYTKAPEVLVDVADAFRTHLC